MDLQLIVFLWVCLCGYLEGNPAVGVVGGVVNMNMTVTDRDINTNRNVKDPNDTIILEFYTGQANPSFTASYVTYTGNISEGFVSFTLSNLIHESAGIYKYFVVKGGPIDVIAGNQYLVIAESPSTPVITQLCQQAVAGRDCKLNCSADSRSEKPGHNLTMYSEWKKNRVNITSDTEYVVNGTILTIRNLNRTDNNAILTCIAFEVQLKKSAESNVFALNVYYGPDNVEITPAGNLTVDEGGNVSIKCSAECNPQCDSYKWQNNSDKGSVGSSQSLVIAPIKREHTGVYLCNITNTAISNSAKIPINIIVNYPPTVNIISMNGSVSDVGHTISCSANGMPEQYTYKLTHISLFSGQIIRHLNYTSVSTGFIVHQFTNLSYMDTGIYTCSVSNGIRDYRDGALYKSVSRTVWIKGAPYLTASDLIFQAEKGQSGRLLVEFYNSLMGAQVAWHIRTTETLTNSSKYNMFVSDTNVSVKLYSVFVHQPGLIATLEVRNVTEQDFTLYEIHVQNEVGEMSPVTLELKPKGPPDIPQNVQIVSDSITSSSVNISWVSGFHGGLNQTFVIEYKKQMDESWTMFSEEIFGGMSHKDLFSVTVVGLDPETLYLFRVYSWNAYRRSEYSTVVNSTTYRYTEHEQYRTGNRADIIIIGGVIGAVLLLTLAVLFVAVLMYRRRRMPHLKSDGLSVNQVYNCTGPVPDLPINSGATVTGDEYAEVVKPEKRASKEENSSDVYAQVDKQTKKWKKGTEKARHGTSSKVVAYENAELVGISSKPEQMCEHSMNAVSKSCDGSLYEESGIASPKGSLMNKDGLLYADLMLDPPKTKTGTHTIRGIDNCTDYAEIAYGKRGEPLPDGDHANQKSDTGGSMNH